MLAHIKAVLPVFVVAAFTLGAVPLLAAACAAHTGEARKNAREALGRLVFDWLGKRVVVVVEASG